jgi:hypothetical protein
MKLRRDPSYEHFIGCMAEYHLIPSKCSLLLAERAIDPRLEVGVRISGRGCGASGVVSETFVSWRDFDLLFVDFIFWTAMDNGTHFRPVGPRQADIAFSHFGVHCLE